VMPCLGFCVEGGRGGGYLVLLDICARTWRENQRNQKTAVSSRLSHVTSVFFVILRYFLRFFADFGGFGRQGHTKV
jgi:hypothetical protein